MTRTAVIAYCFIVVSSIATQIQQYFAIPNAVLDGGPYSAVNESHPLVSGLY